MASGTLQWQSEKLPEWVPMGARHYLAHTETGASIRALARSHLCHPSTILRQIRRFESRRDDPLVDDALRALTHTCVTTKETKNMSMHDVSNKVTGLTQDKIDQEAKRVLRRLCEAGAIMAVASEMETAVIVRETQTGEQLRTAVVDRDIAQAMALKDWISCPDPSGRIARYAVTNAGRAALRRLTAKDENLALGFSDSCARYDPTGAWDIRAIEGDQAANAGRYRAVESPLIGLGRRREKNGKLFLNKEIVAAGERLREDFEIAKMGQKLPDTLAAFLALEQLDTGSKAANEGLQRVQRALTALGAGLSDVVFLCCCLLEGLEKTEKDMGWSARSGKIVLRIALQRLRLHYDEQGKFAPMIG